MFLTLPLLESGSRSFWVSLEDREGPARALGSPNSFTQCLGNGSGSILGCSQAFFFWFKNRNGAVLQIFLVWEQPRKVFQAVPRPTFFGWISIILLGIVWDSEDSTSTLGSHRPSTQGMKDSTGSISESYQAFFRLQYGIGAFLTVFPGLGQPRNMSYADSRTTVVGWWPTVILDIMGDQEVPA